MQRQVALDPGTVPALGDAIIGQSEGMQRVYKMIGRVAQTDATVLIRSETGTGKELVARAVYQHSLRNQAPLLAINCMAVPEGLLESEFFGYEKGAFTGAYARRRDETKGIFKVLMDKPGVNQCCDLRTGLQIDLSRHRLSLRSRRFLYHF